MSVEVKDVGRLFCFSIKPCRTIPSDWLASFWSGEGLTKGNTKIKTSTLFHQNYQIKHWHHSIKTRLGCGLIWSGEGYQIKRCTPVHQNYQIKCSLKWGGKKTKVRNLISESCFMPINLNSFASNSKTTLNLHSTSKEKYISQRLKINQEWSNWGNQSIGFPFFFLTATPPSRQTCV